MYKLGSRRNCHNHRLFPTEEFLQKNPEVDRTILDYTRTETAFAIITFCLIVMGFGFGLYTFKEPRYMFKRLAGGVHFIGEKIASAFQVLQQFNKAHPPRQDHAKLDGKTDYTNSLSLVSELV
ncbi:uncharacterized protein TNCV_3094471 [Trichonephila clavipes]|nr:uncharacterized protein TNCV_3094471 [Trichonephila clavipes]